MIPPTGPFPRRARIRRSREFQELARRGRRRRSEAFVLLSAMRTGTPEGAVSSRLGLTVSRRVGNAVTRNVVKRRIREWFRRDGASEAVGLDLVVIARPAAAELSWSELVEELDGLVRASK